MRLVKNTEKFYLEIYRLRTAPENLKGFVNKSVFTVADHISYMEEYGSYYFILLDSNDIPIGFIGDVDEDIRLAIDPSCHGKGYGLFMLKKFIQISGQLQLKAKVLTGNKASIRLFEKAGFTLYDNDSTFKYYRLQKSNK